MSLLTSVLWVFAFVFFVLATVGIPCPPRFNFTAAGLACIALATLVSRAEPFLTR